MCACNHIMLVSILGFNGISYKRKLACALQECDKMIILMATNKMSGERKCFECARLLCFCNKSDLRNVGGRDLFSITANTQSHKID